jgi:hypothetical protein
MQAASLILESVYWMFGMGEATTGFAALKGFVSGPFSVWAVYRVLTYSSTLNKLFSMYDQLFSVFTIPLALLLGLVGFGTSSMTPEEFATGIHECATGSHKFYVKTDGGGTERWDPNLFSILNCFVKVSRDYIG